MGVFVILFSGCVAELGVGSVKRSASTKAFQRTKFEVVGLGFDGFW